MNRTIIKRDGREVPFQKEKIVNAITKAMTDSKDGVDQELVERIADKVDKRFHTGTVEDVQNSIELELMKSKRKDVAKAYVNYRYLHGLARDKYKELTNLILEKAMAAEDKKQNANVDEKSFGGRTGEANDVIMRRLAMDYILSPTARCNHENNIIYTHDLNSYLVGCHNCLSLPLDDLLAKGFNTRQTDVRPAQSVNTAMQLVAVLFQIQSLQQFGGVSATHLDWTMVPYVRKSFWKHYRDGMTWVEQVNDSEIFSMKESDGDRSIDDHTWKSYKKAYRYAIEMTERETRQSVEGMYHNLNTLQSRSGNQLPFSSINYGTCTLPEGRMITKALLEVSIQGIGKLHKTSIFPCSIFQVMEGVNKHPSDPNYDLFRLALQSTSKRLYPNYANVDWTGNAGYDKNDPRTYFSTINKTVA